MSELFTQLQQANPFDEVSRKQILTDMLEITQNRQWQMEDIDLDQSVRSEKLDLALSRIQSVRQLAPLVSQAKSIRQDSLRRSRSYRRDGQIARADRELALGRRELDALKQSYFDSFQAQELNPRLSMASFSQQFQEDPGVAMQRIEKEKVPLWADAFISQSSSAIKQATLDAWNLISRM